MTKAVSSPEVSMRSYSTINNIALRFGQDNTKREQQLHIVCPSISFPYFSNHACMHIRLSL